MKIWEVNLDVNNYMWCIFTDTEDMNGYEFEKLFWHEETLTKTMPQNPVFHNKDIEENLPSADIMCGGSYPWLVNEKTKRLIENKYSGLFRFFSATIEDLPNEEYHIMFPIGYLELSDYVDMERTEIKYIANDKEKGIFSIRRLVFTQKIRGHHFFRFTDNGHHYKRFIYCDDEFKNFIENNNITGLRFTEVFEFKD